MRDITYLFHPWRTLSAQMMQAGEMPLWNSYAMGGMPFLANCQSAILYPFSIFFFFFPFVVALKLFHLFHYALAGIGFYLFARQIKLSIWASLSGGVLFGFNGYALTRLEFLSTLGSLIWLPWIFLFLKQSRNKQPWLQAIAGGIVISFSLFAGFPQILVLQLMAAGFYSLFCSSPDLRKYFFWGMAGLIFIFLAAAQWLPTAELLPHSIRGGEGVSYEEAGMYSLPVDTLLGLIVPSWMLHHPDSFSGEKYFWIWSGWWGGIVTLLLLFSFRAKNKKLLIFGWTLFFLGIVWSMGNQFDFFETLHKKIILFRLFRYPPVALYLTVTSVALLAAIGLSCFSKSAIPWRKFLVPLTGIVLTLELWIYSRNIQPTIFPEYYSVTFPAIQSVIQDEPGTVMLSPKLYRWRRLSGMTEVEAKMRFRAFLFDLTNLPYRLRTLIPSGEPLALKSFEKLSKKLNQTKSIEEAKPFFNLWNVTHFFTKDSLEKGWKLIATDKDLKAYKNLTTLDSAFALKKSEIDKLSPAEILRPSSLQLQNTKWMASFDLTDERIALFNVPFYPGWKLFCSSCSEPFSKHSPLQPAHGYFTSTQLTRGTHKLYLVYQPAVWRIALVLSLMSVGAITFLFFKKMHATLRP